MLVGLFLRHYKVYKNINFIPVGSGAGFVSYIGPNGSGKSSVLDALDKFFNGGEWSINMLAKSEGGITGDDKVPFIAPVFLIEKTRLRLWVDFIEPLSNYFWTTSYKTVEAMSGFYRLREDLLGKGYSADTHYLISIGKKNTRNAVFNGAFRADAELQKILSEQSITEEVLTDLMNYLIGLYAYFYIPVEADASVYSALESTHVLKLLDEDIRSTIETAIGAKTVGLINASLSEFVKEISSDLADYEYKGPYKNNLTMNDLVEKVFEAYFSIKILHGKRDAGSLPVRDMSAGEKRRALIDLAYSLLARRKERNHSVILAIDEPDASLHTSACYDQFSKLSEIPQLTNPETQILITTHWYGFLPIVQYGTAHVLTNLASKVEFNSFDLYNYREQIKHQIQKQGSGVAIDVELKSHNDMIQSIISSVMRDNPYNWILCEGISDKIYLEYYLRPFISSHNLRIVPLGGFNTVKRVYDYLLSPLSDKEYTPKGKILCLVDTDKELPNVEVAKSSKNIQFKRIIYDEVAMVAKLVDVDSIIRSPATEIEHALEPLQFLAVAASYPETFGGNTLKEIVIKDEYREAAKCAAGFLDLKRSDDSRLMEDFFDKHDNKVRFAYEYAGLSQLSENPLWIDQIIEYFSPALKKAKK
jgi:ABC-type molybdenum transport system ATPase subunit/photorepair protein PhrA